MDVSPYARSHPALPAALPIRLFDGLAPFFHDPQALIDRHGAINWSKIPFETLERDDSLDWATVDAIVPAFEAHLRAMAAIGYNAVALDDLAHLVTHDAYPERQERKLAAYRGLYGRLFAIAKGLGLQVYAITDYMFANAALDEHMDRTGETEADLFAGFVDQAFARFPQLDGILLRIGEGDGVDVAGETRSRLTLQKPAEARALLERLLPIFARRDKTLIFRTWTLGAYPIGDLMWNQATHDAIFAGITSPHLIVSLKYGDADFFRYLSLNPLFFHGPLRKIVELQCRREYEGMGEYPSFVGWLYADYLDALRAGGANLAGVFAIQAGGWAPFSKLAYRAGASPWNELNAYVTAKLALGEGPVESIVSDYCAQTGIARPERLLELLSLAERAIMDGLYIREFAEKPMYFRRVRIPPLAWVFWNNVTAGGLIGRLHRRLVTDPAAAIAQGYAAVAAVRDMLTIAAEENLPTEGLVFQLDTFEILAELRKVLFGVDVPATHLRLETLLADYRARYPHGYRFDAVTTSRGHVGAALSLLFPLLIRRQMHYRRGDRVMLNRHVTRAKAKLVRRFRSGLPAFVDQQGMPSDVLLR